MLWRASGTTQVASFELFVDLLFVGILAINGDHVGEAPNATEMHRFVITFIMAWKIWSDLAVLISWFETDDLVQRLSVLVIMAALLGLTVNMLDAFHESYMMLVAFYTAARVFMSLILLSTAFTVPMVRGMMICQTVIAVAPLGLWIGSIHVDIPQRYALIWVAIFLDLCSPLAVPLVIRNGKQVSKRFGLWIDRVFEFFPAMNIEHKTERTNAFVGLVFGYSVVAILYQNSAHYGLNAFFGKAILGLVQAFCFNWIYFELDGADLFSHAIRRNVLSAMVSSIFSFHELRPTTTRFRSTTFGRAHTNCSIGLEFRSSPLHYGIRPLGRSALKTCCCYGCSKLGLTRSYTFLRGEIGRSYS